MWRRCGSRRWSNPALPLAEPSPSCALYERWQHRSHILLCRPVQQPARILYRKAAGCAQAAHVVRIECDGDAGEPTTAGRSCA